MKRRTKFGFELQRNESTFFSQTKQKVENINESKILSQNFFPMSFYLKSIQRFLCLRWITTGFLLQIDLCATRVGSLSLSLSFFSLSLSHDLFNYFSMILSLSFIHSLPFPTYLFSQHLTIFFSFSVFCASLSLPTTLILFHTLPSFFKYL